MKSIACAALLAAVERFGYDGQGDIVNYLENGDDIQYVEPLTNCVSCFILGSIEISLNF